MSEYRYILQPYNGPATRYRCPQCGKPRKFARYLDTDTGDLLPDHVGRCDREDNCGYHFKPAQYFESIRPIGGAPAYRQPIARPLPEPVRSIQYLPLGLVQKTMAGYERNNFVIYLRSLFGRSLTVELIQRYFIGTSRHWDGATVFWQIDEVERVRQAKVMLYDPATGRRIKDEGSKVFFAGKSLLKNSDANLVQCFFGQHLLAERPGDIVALVESEKSAVLASVYFPKLIWIATGGKHGARWTDTGISSALSGREIILFPDLNAYEAWKQKADEVKRTTNCKIAVSDLLENIANDQQRAEGWDLADYLVKRDEPARLAITDQGYPVMWDAGIVNA